MSAGKSSGKKSRMRSISLWEIPNARVSNAESVGSTFCHQTFAESLGRQEKTFSSCRDKSNLGINGQPLLRRSLAAQRTRLKTDSTPCSKRSGRRRPSDRTWEATSTQPSRVSKVPPSTTGRMRSLKSSGWTSWSRGRGRRPNSIRNRPYCWESITKRSRRCPRLATQDSLNTRWVPNRQSSNNSLHPVKLRVTD